jgi:hypothetical protein
MTANTLTTVEMKFKLLRYVTTRRLLENCGVSEERNSEFHNHKLHNKDMHYIFSLFIL